MRRAFFLAIACLAFAAAAAAQVRSIADVRGSAKEGDLVTVEGQITDVGTASGSVVLVTLEDDSDSVLVKVPDHMLRKLNDGKSPEEDRRVRVSGRWGHAYLDDEVWGIEAQNAERIE